MLAFCERPHDARFAALDALEAAVGPTEWSYVGHGITVTVPRGRYVELCEWASAHRLHANGCWYFPLGSDKPPDILRHDGSYPGSKGFRLYQHFDPIGG